MRNFSRWDVANSGEPIGSPYMDKFYDPTTVALQVGGSLLGSALSSDAASSAAQTQANAANAGTNAQLQMFNTINSQQAPYRQAGQTALSDIMGGLGLGPATGSVGASGAVASSPQSNPDLWSTIWHKYSDPTGQYIDQSSPLYADILAKTQAEFNAQNQATTPLSAVGGAAGTVGGAAGTVGGTPTGTPANYFTHQFNADDLKTNLAPNYQFQLDQGLKAVKNAGNLQTGLLSGNTLQGINNYAQDYAGGAYQQAYNNYTANQSNIFNRLSTIAGLGNSSNQQSATAATATGQGVANTLGAAGAATASGQVGSANALTGGLNNALGWYSLSNIMKGGANPTGTYGAPNAAGDYGMMNYG